MAIRRTVQLIASVTASGDALASITVPARSKLRRVQWQVNPTGVPVTGDRVELELSVNAARQVTTNDATGILSIHGHAFGIVTSGSTQANTHSQEVDVQFNAGDKLYLHASENGTQTYLVRVLCYFE